eukprot:g4962.t1
MENMCEYVSQDGEVRNVLQFFCECEDLDEAFTSLVSPDATAPTGTSTTARAAAWKRALAVAQDRARVPWPGGARRLDLAWVLAAALQWLFWSACRRSTSLLQVVTMVATCFAGLGYSHLRALRRRSDSQFHVAWMALSVLGLYSRYREGVALTLSTMDDLIAHVMLLALVSSYGHCCLVDPGRDQGGRTAETDEIEPGAPLTGKQREDQGLVGTEVVYVNDDAGSGSGGGSGAREAMLEEREARRALLLRSGRCSVCRRTFRLRDHHCVWVGQCIAERNRRSFLAFLLLLAGLSAWFARRTAACLLSTASGSAAGLGFDREEEVWPGAAGLLRLNRGGEDVAVALYAFTASLLAAALAAQQILLVSLGVTSLELRRGRKPSTLVLPAARPIDDNAATAAAAAGKQPQRRVVAPPPVLSARRIAGNWYRFLSGTEIPVAVPGRAESAPRRPPPLSPRRLGQGQGQGRRVGSPSAAAAAAAARGGGLEIPGGNSRDRILENPKNR